MSNHSITNYINYLSGNPTPDKFQRDVSPGKLYSSNVSGAVGGTSVVSQSASMQVSNNLNDSIAGFVAQVKDAGVGQSSSALVETEHNSASATTIFVVADTLSTKSQTKVA
jgi:hypothetical protein